MANFLEQWFDPALDVPAWKLPDFDDYEEQQQARLTEQYTLFMLAHQQPRRIGSDASREDLAADKRITKRIATRTLTVLKMWGAQEADATEALLIAQNDADSVRQAAQLLIPNWWGDHKTFLRNELTHIATISMKSGFLKHGNRFTNRHLNEINTLGQLLEEN